MVLHLVLESLSVRSYETYLYIKYNHNNLDENELNRAIINLSHRVFKSHGLKGHNTRQKIGQILVNYSKIELAKYNVSFQRPLKAYYINHKYRYPRVQARWAMRAIKRILLFLAKITWIIIVVIIILYIIFHVL